MGQQDAGGDSEFSGIAQKVPEDVDYIVKVEGEILEDKSTEVVARAIYDAYREEVKNESLSTRRNEEEGLPDTHTEYIENEAGLPGLEIEGVEEMVLMGNLSGPRTPPTALLSSNWSVDDMVTELEEGGLNVTRDSYKGIETYEGNWTLSEGFDGTGGETITITKVADFGDGEFAISGLAPWTGRLNPPPKLSRIEDTIDVYVGDKERFSGELEEGYRRVNHGLFSFVVKTEGANTYPLQDLLMAEGVYFTEEGDIVSKTRMIFNSTERASDLSSSLNESLLENGWNEDIRNVTSPVRIKRNDREVNITYRIGAERLAEGVKNIAGSEF